MNKPRISAFLLLVCLLAPPFVSLAVSSQEESPRDVVVEGRIEIFEMDANDTVTDISLENEEMTYVVKKNNKAMELFKKIGSDIRATGRVIFDGKGMRLIEISAYELINP